MAFLKKENKEDVNYLELTPLAHYEYERRNDGLINVLVPKFSNKILTKLIVPMLKSPYIRANMDELGTAVWLQIDGKTKVYQIASKLEEQFGEKISPVYDRLTIFLTQLYNAGFISFKELKKGKHNG